MAMQQLLLLANVLVATHAAAAAANIGVLHSSCSDAGDCSARLQALLSACSASDRGGGGPGCTISFSPSGAQFAMEQTAALNATRINGLAMYGGGAKLLLRGDAPFLNARECADLSLSNLTLATTRPAFTFGVVVPAVGPGLVTLSVDTGRYPMKPDQQAWTRQVDALHEVDPATFEPLPGGLDWLFDLGRPETQLQLKANLATSTVSFLDAGFRFKQGTGVVLRHMLEFTHRQLDSIVLHGCTQAVLSDITIHSSPGIGVLAFDCTGVLLERVRNIPESAALPLAGNADAMHFASCRGEVVVRDCIADRQGDDGLNVHSQYGIVQRVIGQPVRQGNYVYKVQVGSHVNADNTSWADVFARAVFRVNDTVVVQRASSGLGASAGWRVSRVEGSPTALPLILTLEGGGMETVSLGDIIESVSAVPSSVSGGPRILYQIGHIWAYLNCMLCCR